MGGWLNAAKEQREVLKWETTVSLCGWGRIARATHTAYIPHEATEAQAAISVADDTGIIAHGRGRSYGDAALNSGGRVLLTQRFNRIIQFDPSDGTVVCEPGVTFYDLFREFLPRGYMVPVTPGTGFATIGGAVANDVHGKNHEVAGSFGDYIRWMDLLLPSGEIVRISSDREPELFAATIGGVGLTGIITAVCFTMRPVHTNAVLLREARIRNLDEFFEAFERVRRSATFSVGWIDALARGRRLGRGILEIAEPASCSVNMAAPKRLRVPLDFPRFALNAWAVRAFNHFYYRRIPTVGRERLLAFDRFFYPLDALQEWNRIYGKRGFYQFQCVLPDATSAEGIARLLTETSRARAGSFLAVLKTLGGEGRGYLSFPMRGYTLALDFPARPGIKELLKRLERITMEHGGRVYLAKDACLSPEAFRAMYPKLDAFRAVLEAIDPDGRFNSDLARRIGIRECKQSRTGQRVVRPAVEGTEVICAGTPSVAGPIP